MVAIQRSVEKSRSQGQLLLVYLRLCLEVLVMASMLHRHLCLVQIDRGNRIAFRHLQVHIIRLLLEFHLTITYSLGSRRREFEVCSDCT